MFVIDTPWLTSYIPPSFGLSLRLDDKLCSFLDERSAGFSFVQPATACIKLTVLSRLSSVIFAAGAQLQKTYEHTSI